MKKTYSEDCTRRLYWTVFCGSGVDAYCCRHALASTDLGKQYVFLNENVLEGVSIMADCYLSESEKNTYKRLREERNRIGIDKSILARKEFRGEGLYIDQILK